MISPGLRPTFAELEAHLRAEGLAPEPSPQGVAPPTTPADNELPWFVRVLVGLGAWLSAVFLLALIALAMGREIEGASIFIGLFLMVAGALVLRSANGATGMGVFLCQGALAATLAGQGLFIFGVSRAGGGDVIPALAALGAAGATIVAVREPAARFLSTVGAAAALGWVLVAAHVPHSFDVLALVLGGATAALWLTRPARFARTGEDALAAVAYGFTVAFLATLLLATRLGPLDDLFRDDLAPPSRLASVGLGVGAVGLALFIRRELGLGRPTPLTAAGLAGLALLGPVTPGAPGLVGAVAVLLLAFHRREPILLALAVIFLVAFLGGFYYAMTATLLVKALNLGLAGAALLGAALIARAESWAMTRRQFHGLWGGLALILVVVNVAAVGKERVRRDGQRVLLELAPADPRSLMQGDYMRLNLAIAAQLRRERWSGADEAGLLVLQRDADGVGRYARVARPGEALGRDELFLRYRRAGEHITVGPDAFLFQEGEAERYVRARYADVRVSADGEAVLIGLRDRDRQPLE